MTLIWSALSMVQAVAYGFDLDLHEFALPI
jgi:hypothetical protein